MSKTILADVDGFTPVIDRIVAELGLASAAVFGNMWRFCQMGDGVCKASLEKIAERLGIDRATVMRHADKLCKAGYLRDVTPDFRNAPHIYADTGKASIRVGVTVALCNSLEATVAESGETVAQCNATVAESKLKIVLKKDHQEQEREDDDLSLKTKTEALEKLYLESFGEVRPLIRGMLRNVAMTYPQPWYAPAFEAAAKNHGKSLAYVEAILENWKRDGRRGNGKKRELTTAEKIARFVE